MRFFDGNMGRIENNRWRNQKKRDVRTVKEKFIRVAPIFSLINKAAGERQERQSNEFRARVEFCVYFGVRRLCKQAKLLKPH